VEYLAQMEMTECGAASLAMVLAFHGHHASLPEVRQACGVSRDGASALAILRAARGYGLEAEGVRAELDELPGLPCPAILHWGFDHFLVLERVLRQGALLVDPAHGRRRVDRAELDRSFTGAVLLFEPGPAFRPRARTRPSLAKYRDTIRASLPSLAQADLGIALGTGADIAIEAAPLVLMGNSLDAVVETLRLAQRTFRIVRQNLFWAFAYNVVGITLAVAGVLTPILAAGAMVLSSLSVIGNSRRSVI